MNTHRIAAIPGDGIGTEVIAAGLEVLAALAERDGGFRIEPTHFDWGSDRYLREGAMMPADGLDQIKSFDAIYFGSAGDPRVPDHITLWGLRLAICQPFDQYANVRPARILPGVESPLRGVGPGDLDWVIVRENSEGEYSGAGGRRVRASVGHDGQGSDASVLAPVAGGYAGGDFAGDLLDDLRRGVRAAARSSRCLRPRRRVVSDHHWPNRARVQRAARSLRGPKQREPEGVPPPT